jgi:hypothetical protein
MVFRALFQQLFVDKLHIGQHVFFSTLSGALAKATIVYQDYVIAKPVKVSGVFGPSFNTSGIAMKIEDESLGFFAIKMKSINTHTWSYVKKQFLKRRVILVFKVLRQLLRFKDKALLYQIGKEENAPVNEDDI